MIIVLYVRGIKTQTRIAVKILVTGLHHSRGLEFLPDGKMIVSEKPGTIRIISTLGKIGNSFANVPPVRNVGDAGLLDIKLDPDFASTRLVFWSYVKDSAGTGRNIVARARLSKMKLLWKMLK